MSALIGALRASLSLETAQFEAGAKRAQRTANNLNSSFKKSFGGLGAITKAGLAGVVSGLSIGLITQGVKAALDYAGSLKEVSQQLGVTTKDLQVFRFAAGQVGVSQAELERGLQRLTVTLGKVEAGAKAPAKALAAIGISVDEIRRLDTGEAFRVIADGLEKVTDRSQRAAVEVALFGREGAKLDNLLAGGSSQINELSLAAEKLGIVLSDEQIQKADDTADKLEALKTVLSAQIAGVVADNADSILALADALVAIVGAAAKALNAFSAFVSYVKQNPLSAINPGGALGGFVGQQIINANSGNVRGFNKAGRSVTVPLTSKAPNARRGADIGKFLAGGGGGGRSRKGGADDAERKRLEALRNAYQFDQDLLRAQMDVVRAQQQLATDFSERAALSIQLLNLDKQAFERQLQYEVAAGELTKAQAAQLEAEFTKRDALERQAVLAEEEAQRKEDYNRLEQLDFDLQRDILESQEQLAETAAEQRDLRLKILELDYRAERARLETVLADEKASYAAKEEARRRLAALEKTQANDQQAVKNSTRGPLEAYMSGLPLDPAKLNEALENVAVNGLQRLEDGLLDVIDGTKSVGQAFKELAQSIIKDLLRISIQRAIIGPLANMLFGGGGIGGGLGSGLGGDGIGGYGAYGAGVLNGSIPLRGVFSSGGYTGSIGRNRVAGLVHGNEYVLNAAATRRIGIPALNAMNSGIPLPNFSHGERVNISNDNSRMDSRPIGLTQNFYGNVSRETAMQAGAKARAGIAAANRKGA